MNKKISEESKNAQSVTQEEKHINKIKKTNEEIEMDKKPPLQAGEIGQAILRACSDFDIDIFRKFNIKREDIMTGVQCPECGRLAMYRAFGIWQCNHCQKRSRSEERRVGKECRTR